VQAQWSKTPLRELGEDQSWSNKSIAFIRGKPNSSLTCKAKFHNKVATSSAMQIIRLEVFLCFPYNTHLALSNFWLFVVLKQHLEGFRLTCYEPVQAATIIFFENRHRVSKRLFRKTCSATTLYLMTERICGVKTNTMCEAGILCLTSITFMGIRTQSWKHYFPSKLPIKWINFTVLRCGINSSDSRYGPVEDGLKITINFDLSVMRKILIW